MKKILFLILYILFHLFILREIRTEIFSMQINDGFLEKVEFSDQISIIKLDTRLINFEYKSESLNKVLRYRISFGYFFLCSIAGLIILGVERQFFYLLIGIHLIYIPITSVLIQIGYFSGYKSLIINDLLSTYLIPLSSIAIIPLAIMKRKADQE